MTTSAALLFETNGVLDLHSPTGQFLTITKEFRRARRIALKTGAIPVDAYIILSTEGMCSRHSEVIDTLAKPEDPIWDRETIAKAERYLGIATELLQQSLISVTAASLHGPRLRPSPLALPRVFLTYLELIAGYEDGLYEFVGYED